MLASCKATSMAENGVYGNTVASRSVSRFVVAKKSKDSPLLQRASMPTSLNTTPRHIPDLVVRTPDHSQPAPTDRLPNSPPAPLRANVKNGPRAREIHHQHSRTSSHTSAKGVDSERGSQKEVDAMKKEKKKTRASVFSFLALKEPSTAAFEEMVRQQNIQSKRTSTSGSLAGSVLQQLPASVAKVNSKWNGLPEVGSKSTSRPSRLSSSGTTRESVSKQRHGSLSSRPAGHWTREESRAAHSPPTLFARKESAESWTSRPPIPAPLSLPALRPEHQRDEAQDNSYGHTFLDPPSPTMPSSGHSSPPPPLQRDTSSFIASSEASPRTPSSDEMLHGPTRFAIALKDDKAAMHRRHDSEENGTFWLNSDSEDIRIEVPRVKQSTVPLSEAVRPQVEEPETSCRPEAKDTAKVLLGIPRTQAPPETHPDATNPSRTRPRNDVVRNFSHISKYHRRVAADSSSVTTGSTSVTLAPSNARALPPTIPARQSSLAMKIATPTPTIAEKEEAHRLTHHASDSDASSTSVVSAQWTMLPKDRLSLGAKIIKDDDVLPWETFDPPRSSISSVGAVGDLHGDAGTWSRLSQRWSRKLS